MRHKSNKSYACFCFAWEIPARNIHLDHIDFIPGSCQRVTLFENYQDMFYSDPDDLDHFGYSFSINRIFNWRKTQ